MASSSKPAKDDKAALEILPAGITVNSIPEQFAYGEVVAANRYETLMLERCHKQENGDCEIVRLIGLWDKCDNEWVSGYPEAVDLSGKEWHGDTMTLRPVFGGKPDCRGPIPGPPGIQGIQGPDGLVGMQGFVGPAGPDGAPGPYADCSPVDEDCPPFAYDQEAYCVDEGLYTPFATAAGVGIESPDYDPTSANFNPSLIPASVITIEADVVNYTNNTECCQEIQCYIQSGHEILLSADPGGSLSMAFWVEDESGQFVPETFQKLTFEPATGGTADSKNFPLISTPWVEKLNPGESVNYSVKMGLLSYSVSPALASNPNNAILFARISAACISCRVSTVGVAQ